MIVRPLDPCWLRHPAPAAPGGRDNPWVTALLSQAMVTMPNPEPAAVNRKASAMVRDPQRLTAYSAGSRRAWRAGGTSDAAARTGYLTVGPTTRCMAQPTALPAIWTWRPPRPTRLRAAKAARAQPSSRPYDPQTLRLDREPSPIPRNYFPLVARPELMTAHSESCLSEAAGPPPCLPHHRGDDDWSPGMPWLVSLGAPALLGGKVVRSELTWLVRWTNSTPAPPRQRWETTPAQSWSALHHAESLPAPGLRSHFLSTVVRLPSRRWPATVGSLSRRRSGRA